MIDGKGVGKALDCAGRVHCAACRGDARFRQTLVAAGIVEERDFECAYGVTVETAGDARFYRQNWPGWARLLATGAAPPDRGLGDTLARRFGGAGEAFKAGFKALVGRACGCAERQETLNQKYPFRWGEMIDGSRADDR
jgi:hypothetical protein